ncbi:hypothetical protein [Deinococcus sp. UYEF24]
MENSESRQYLAQAKQHLRVRTDPEREGTENSGPSVRWSSTFSATATWIILES